MVPFGLSWCSLVPSLIAKWRHMYLSGLIFYPPSVGIIKSEPLLLCPGYTMETIGDGFSRTVDDVLDTLELATIKESDLTNVTHVLYSAHEDNVDKHLKLLEIDDHLLETIKKGDSLTFQGTEEDPVVLCTKDQTYDIKETETSNSCLLVPSASLFEKTSACTNGRTIKHSNILGIFHTYYEVKECKPKLERLFDLLEPTSFKGMEYESSIPHELLYNWDRLQSEIQASEEELKKALKEYLIVNINGYFRLISFESEARSLTLMLDLFDENCWEIDEVDKEITYDYLKEFIHESVFDALFTKYTEISQKSRKDGTPLYRYNEELCCKSLAKILLAASSITEHKQFMESWNIGTPEKMKPREEYLRGIALIKWNSFIMKNEVVAFPETDLPKDTEERFNALFKAKDKWTVEEITPYISCLTINKVNVNTLLTKYARCSVVNGIRYYSSKHGK